MNTDPGPTDPGAVDDRPDVVRHADAAYEAMRSINHLTLWAKLPAPVVYTILGDLKGLGHMMPQALGQLAQGLGRSLDEYDVYEDDVERNPVQSIAIATDHLRRAAELAAQVGVELDYAQTAIAGQGYRETRPNLPT